MAYNKNDLKNEFKIFGIYKDINNQGNIFIQPTDYPSLEQFMKKHIKNCYGNFTEENDKNLNYTSIENIKTDKLYKVR